MVIVIIVKRFSDKQETKNNDYHKFPYKGVKFLLYIFHRLLNLLNRPTVCVTGLVGGTLTHSTGRKMLGMLKMLEKPHRTHKSSARFVGQ